jgi:hypothetical protein
MIQIWVNARWLAAVRGGRCLPRCPQRGGGARERLKVRGSKRQLSTTDRARVQHRASRAPRWPHAFLPSSTQRFSKANCPRGARHIRWARMANRDNQRTEFPSGRAIVWPTVVWVLCCPSATSTHSPPCSYTAARRRRPPLTTPQPHCSSCLWHDTQTTSQRRNPTSHSHRNPHAASRLTTSPAIVLARRPEIALRIAARRAALEALRFSRKDICPAAAALPIPPFHFK